MSLTVTPIVPLMWWVIVAIVSVFVVVAWGSYAKSKNRLNASWAMVVIVIVCMLGATLNPGVLGTKDTVDAKGFSADSTYDLYFVVDTTSSIAAEDWGDKQPRLDGVKLDIRKIVSQYPNSRYMLITFDQVAEVRVPITTDSSALLSTTNALQQEVTANSAGSSIGESAKLLTSSLAGNADSSRHALAFFFSDGEQTTNKPVESFASAKKYISSGLVLGYGTAQGGKMKERVGITAPNVYIKDSKGIDGVSRIDETNLRVIAKQLGVRYLHRVTDDQLDVSPKSKDSVIGKITAQQPTVFGLYWIFALLIFLVLCTAFIQTIRSIQMLSKRGGIN